MARRQISTASDGGQWTEPDRSGPKRKGPAVTGENFSIPLLTQVSGQFLRVSQSTSIFRSVRQGNTSEAQNMYSPLLEKIVLSSYR